MNFAEQLRDEAAERAKGQKARLSQLQRSLDDLEAELAKLRSEREAARLAHARLASYVVQVGADYQCPACWIGDEQRSALTAVPSATDDDILRCRKCGTRYVLTV